MNYAIFLGRRLALGSEGRKSSPGIKVATAAIALSVAVMIASISIVMGFKREITEKVVGFTSHIIMTSQSDNNLITLTPTLKNTLKSQEYVADFSLQVSLPAILKTPDDFKGIFLKNLDDRATRLFIKKNLISGYVPDYSNDSASLQIVLSRLAASQLNLKQGDKVDCFFINDDVKVRRLKIAGIYDSHFDAYDNLMVYGSRSLLNAFSSLNDNQGSSLLITVNDFSKLDEVTSKLQKALDLATSQGLLYKNYELENAHVGGANYFHWLNMLDTNVIVVLTLMMIVGCVTLISGMLTIILDKKRFIGLMKSLGATNRKLREVFVYLSLRVAILGMLIGNALIISLLFLQDKYHYLKLDATSYYIDYVPVDINWVSIACLNFGVAVVIYLILFFPSRIISKISPSETMRNE